MIHTAKSLKTYFKPFFWFYLFFYIHIVQYLVHIYSLAYIERTYSDIQIYFIVLFSSIIFVLFMIFSIITYHNVFNIKNRKLLFILIGILSISFIIVMTPICISFTEDMKSIIFKKPYFLIFSPYILSYIYVLGLTIFRIGKLIKREDRIFTILYSTFILSGFIESMFSYVYKIFNPIIRMDSQGSGVFESTFTFLILSIFCIIFIKRKFIIKKPPIDFNELISQGFTKREAEIITLIIKNFTNKKIGEKLYISISTVKSHINNIYKKKEVTNRLDLINEIYKT